MLSVRPEYAARIFDGSKTVELRRTSPRIAAGNLVIVYETSPTRAVVGYFVVAGISTRAPAALWGDVKDRAGITRREYRNYFVGSERATAIWVAYASRFKQRLSLETLQSTDPAFAPPQSYRYLDSLEPLFGLLVAAGVNDGQESGIENLPFPPVFGASVGSSSTRNGFRLGFPLRQEQTRRRQGRSRTSS
jgi:predicted transcriptional regulator